MIRLGLRSGAQVESALRLVVDEFLSLLVDLASAYHEAGDLAPSERWSSIGASSPRRQTMTRWRRQPNRVWRWLAPLLPRRSIEQSEQHVELTRFVALLCDTVIVVGGDSHDPSRDISQAADRVRELLETRDFGELRARLAEEVTGLHRLGRAAVA